ncbi:ParB family chromosome partitioning protein [Ruminiclostridium sufflavum DSM 19573]|uniref:ParB family chromosome partitioning protein n=1 Tax=Ruminiclostridium sufflavum DSM 19573 TaxID=1121337 RepID=A0A318XRY1_9FIRM|nr:ParB/RepB/Spo0J family partition protein [Ruminiclostridium sufflavum]PYG89001.1 ParB family chromosome partitioning protein [Ruminiclostridium sufflavum DSM 19573]
MIKKGLGKGLGALITNDSIEDSTGVVELKINEIEPNAGQPRKNFDDEKLLQLSESIKQHGVIQPIIVKKKENTYTIIAGERRWRAAKLAGVTTIPALIKEYTELQVMEIALIENLQREDLNPIEEADAFINLMNEFKLTQEQIAEKIGRSRSAIANTMRLLGLSKDVKRFIISGDLTSGHARTLVIIENEELQKTAAEYIINNKLSVRETENYIKTLLNKKEKKNNFKNDNPEYKYVEDKLKNILGTKVKLQANKNRGKITIEYYSNDELDRLLDFFYTKS